MGITFVEKVSKLKFDMAKKKAEKLYKRLPYNTQKLKSQENKLDNFKSLV